MTDVCFYFQVHQPVRLRRLHLFNMPEDVHYWDDAKNAQIFHRVADKCYLPTNKLLLDLIEETEGAFRVSFALSGTFVEQAKQFRPEVMQSFRALAETGAAEFLDETYYHSLAGLWEDQAEFREQVQAHRDLMRKELGVEPTIFRNTELIYDNRIAQTVEGMGYKAIFTEGVERVLGTRSANLVYQRALAPLGGRPQPEDASHRRLRVLLKNYQLSDDIAFRFSNPDWPEYPLTAEKYGDWLAKQEGHTVNLFMDYETFGEHNWQESGIFGFLRHLPGEALRRGVSFATPSEVVEKHEPADELEVPFAISWADTERDVSAWLHNEMQQQCFNTLRDMAPLVKELKDPDVTHAWRLLQTSDHVYYCTTKHMGDQDIHMYFSPYDSPYQAFINYMNCIVDLKNKVVARLRK